MVHQRTFHCPDIFPVRPELHLAAQQFRRCRPALHHEFHESPLTEETQTVHPQFARRRRTPVAQHREGTRAGRRIAPARLHREVRSVLADRRWPRRRLARFPAASAEHADHRVFCHLQQQARPRGAQRSLRLELLHAMHHRTQCAILVLMALGVRLGQSGAEQGDRSMQLPELRLDALQSHELALNNIQPAEELRARLRRKHGPTSEGEKHREHANDEQQREAVELQPHAKTARGIRPSSGPKSERARAGCRGTAA
mmetsp:Transcript_108168/g.304684  ORF Transcript_108168/g.304684 Transcript_108168/m.304684 type:complete len:256 (+) Transcript_108168:897-1664(+)